MVRPVAVEVEQARVEPAVRHTEDNMGSGGGGGGGVGGRSSEESPQGSSDTVVGTVDKISPALRVLKWIKKDCIWHRGGAPSLFEDEW